MSKKISDIKDPDYYEIPPTYLEKKQVLNFFFYKNYKVLKTHHELNECDFVENIRKIENYYRKQGQLLGLFTIYASWDTLLMKFVPISKIFLGIVLMTSLSEYSLYRNIDNLYNPLSCIFEKNYRPLLRLIPNEP